MVCVKTSLDFSNIDVALLEVLGIAVYGFPSLSIYNPPPRFFHPTLQKLFSDFNANHGMWGSEYTNCSGRSLLEALDVHDLVVLNTTTPTHFISLDAMHVRLGPCL